MADLYKGKIPIIRRSLNEGYIRGTPDEAPTFGMVPRDFDIDPVIMGDSPQGMVLIPESEYDARWEEAEENESSLEHMFLRDGEPAFKFLDQDRFPDCWFYSTAHAIMLDCLKQNIEIPRLNATAGATLVGRLDGGWSGLSMKFARDNGVPIMGNGEGEWPEHTRNRKYDTPAMREKMKAHKTTEHWYDFGRREWEQTLSKRQLATCSFNNIPCPTDWNRFGHAMCQLRYVRIEKGYWGWLTLNSHGQWGYHGLGVFAGMNPDQAVGLRSSAS